MDGIRIVDSRMGSTPASSWTEYLCVRLLQHSLYELSIRSFEYLGEHSDYADEEGNIPDTVEGKTVMSVEDGRICGGDLVFMDGDSSDVVRFRDVNSPTIAVWLKSKRWLHDGVNELIEKAIAQ